MMRQARFTGGVIVDFGCGSGVFTNAIASAAPTGSRVCAIDFFEEPPRELGAMTYLPLPRLGELAGQCDLVTCFHVLEHDDDPARLLAQLIGLLKPGGIIVIEVPNADCIWRVPFRGFWDDWYLPYHRVHFTRASLRGLCQRMGLTIESEHDHHAPAMGRSIARFLGRPNGLVFVLLSAFLQPLQWVAEVTSARPSALRIIARKQP